jgi:hypothetical protein
MQTWSVHMRSPRRLYAELGPAGFATFQLVVGGNVLAALIHPIFVAGTLYALAAGYPLLGQDGAPAVLTWLFGTTLLAGYATSIALGLRGLARRGLLSTAWVLALVPVHWLLLSLAGWRALYQLARNPHGWEKTAHGLARSSRRAKLASSATLRAALGDMAATPPRPRRAA